MAAIIARPLLRYNTQVRVGALGIAPQARFGLSVGSSPNYVLAENDRRRYSRRAMRKRRRHNCGVRALYTSHPIRTDRLCPCLPGRARTEAKGGLRYIGAAN